MVVLSVHQIEPNAYYVQIANIMHTLNKLLDKIHALYHTRCRRAMVSFNAFASSYYFLTNAIMFFADDMTPFWPLPKSSRNT